MSIIESLLPPVLETWLKSSRFKIGEKYNITQKIEFTFIPDSLNETPQKGDVLIYVGKLGSDHAFILEEYWDTPENKTRNQVYISEISKELGKLQLMKKPRNKH